MSIESRICENSMRGRVYNPTATAREAREARRRECASVTATLAGRGVPVDVVPPEVVPFEAGLNEPPGRLLPDCPAFARAPLARVPFDFGTNPD